MNLELDLELDLDLEPILSHLIHATQGGSRRDSLDYTVESRRAKAEGRSYILTQYYYLGALLFYVGAHLYDVPYILP